MNEKDTAETGADQRQHSQLARWAAMPVEQLSALVGRQYVVGTNVMVARLSLKKGAKVPLHNHHHEQIACVLEGSLEFSIEGEVLVLRAGEVLCIPPHVPHEVLALEDTINLDIFSPPREDWIAGKDAYLRG